MSDGREAHQGKAKAHEPEGREEASLVVTHKVEQGHGAHDAECYRSFGLGEERLLALEKTGSRVAVELGKELGLVDVPEVAECGEHRVGDDQQGESESEFPQEGPPGCFVHRSSSRPLFNVGRGGLGQL